MENKDLQILSGESLVPELINVTSLAVEMEEVYLTEFVKRPTVKVSLSKEKEKYETIENLTKAQLKDKIFCIIKNLPDNQARLMQDHFKLLVNGKNKDQYIGFYEEITELHRNLDDIDTEAGFEE